jgi:peptide methionine sulfoxide reductase msrA/msrB
MKKDIILNTLTSEEERVIVHKGTEMPYTWHLVEEKREGTFLCKQCNAPLYSSDMKFDSGCGWPAFDDALPWQVKETTDSDGYRTEITCQTCGWHLGHIFRGERFTETNERHCVNSVSMKFVAERVDAPPQESMEIAVFGWGCYRCVEAVLQRLEWVVDIQSGFMWWNIENPTYDDIAYNETGHIEVVQVKYDSSVISYQTLLNVFFTAHDPTTLNRQWNDIWTQYASVIFTHDDAHKELAQATIHSMNERKVFAPDMVVTQVRDASTFWKWPGAHQDYYDQNKSASYCQFVIAPKVKKLRDSYEDLLKEEYMDEVE